MQSVKINNTQQIKNQRNPFCLKIIKMKTLYSIYLKTVTGGFQYMIYMKQKQEEEKNGGVGILSGVRRKDVK